MKKLITLVLALVVWQFSYTQNDCNVFFDDFEDYTINNSITYQSPDNWIRYANDSDPAFIRNWGQTPPGNYLDLAGFVNNSHDINIPETVQILQIENSDTVHVKFKFYNECGMLALHFLETFVNANNQEILGKLIISNFGDQININDQGFNNCINVFNGFFEVELILDFINDKIILLCDSGSDIVVDFLQPGSDLFGLAWGSNQCAFIDDICISKNIVDLDMDGFNSDEDCDDNNADINPEAIEIPNNDIDENCDGIAEITDVDMDNFNSDEDCDDNNADINPDAIEIPNNDIDENCDGIAEIIDLDMDNFNSDEDCDDNNADINPDAIEIPNNDIDENCDGIAEIIDVDMDNFNSDEDCDDNNADINPDAIEIPNNDIDENCDGIAEIIDLDMDNFNSDEDCDDNNADINPDAIEIPNNDIDENCDGIAEIIDVDMDNFNSDEDCDDNNADINPDAIEIPNNGIDENCDGIAEIIDLDMDNFNSDEDCDDNNADINPDAIEIPNNGIDEDCDGFDLTTNLNEQFLDKIIIIKSADQQYLYIENIPVIGEKIVLFDSNGLVLNSINISRESEILAIGNIPPGVCNISFYAKSKLLGTKRFIIY